MKSVGRLVLDAGLRLPQSFEDRLARGLEIDVQDHRVALALQVEAGDPHLGSSHFAVAGVVVRDAALVALPGQDGPDGRTERRRLRPRP
jgi:hypothetical protein